MDTKDLDHVIFDIDFEEKLLMNNKKYRALKIDDLFIKQGTR